MRKHRYSIALDRQSREPIRDNNGQVAVCRLKHNNRVGVQRPAAWMAQIRSTISRVRPQLKNRNRGLCKKRKLNLKTPRKHSKIQRSMHSIPRLSVIQLKLEQLRRRNAIAGGGQRYARRSVIAKVKSKMGTDCGHPMLHLLGEPAIE